MASSLPEQILYNTTTKRFTEAGIRYIHSYFAKTPRPTINQLTAIEEHTGCSISTLKRKFSIIRRKSPSIYMSLRISNALDFLNTITMEQAMALKAKFLTPDAYERFINPEHIDSDINSHEISSFTSKKIHNGQFLHDFMSCLIKSNNLTHPSQQDSFINITPACTRWPSVKKSAKKFCTSRSLKKLPIPHHYICLRARKSTLPTELSTGDMQISRLCTTNSCIEDEHLLIENTSISTGRQKCGGILLVLQPYGPTTSKHIVKIEPCKHGLEHPDADGDFLRFSCRKIQVTIMDEISMAFFDNLRKAKAC